MSPTSPVFFQRNKSCSNCSLYRDYIIDRHCLRERQQRVSDLSHNHHLATTSPPISCLSPLHDNLLQQTYLEYSYLSLAWFQPWHSRSRLCRTLHHPPLRKDMTSSKLEHNKCFTSTPRPLFRIASELPMEFFAVIHHLISLTAILCHSSPSFTNILCTLTFILTFQNTCRLTSPHLLRYFATYWPRHPTTLLLL